MQPEQSNTTRLYAGFFLRLVAFAIDLLVLASIMWAITAIPSGFGGSKHQTDRAHYSTEATNSEADQHGNIFLPHGSFGVYDKQIIALMVFLCWWLYYSFLESSEFQATVGKGILGLRVTDTENRRISFGRATLRFWGMIFSCLILFVGILMIAYDPKHQGLHDRFAKCLIVSKRYQL